MTRFRTTQFNNPQYSSSDFTRKIRNRETLKFARSVTNISNTSKITNQFSLSCMLGKKYVEVSNNEITCCNNNNPSLNSNTQQIWQPDIYIATFNNYNSMINLLLEQATLDNQCFSCPDVPITLNNALTSEFCFDDYFNSISKLTPHPCKCLPIRDIDICQLESHKLYPYGHFNNNNPNVNKALRRRLILNCNKKEPCPTYIYCKCPPDQINCKCCDYTVSFPFKGTFVNYVVSGCKGKELWTLVNNPGNNPNKTYSNYLDQLNSNKQFKRKAIYSFGLNYII